MLIARTIQIATLTTLIAAPGLAQDRPWESVPAIDKVRPLVGKDRPKWAKVNYKLEIELGNGRKIIGIAKGGKLFEKIVLTARKYTEFETKLKREYNIKASRGMSQVFVIAKHDDPTVGIRLWHHDTTGSYIFILYEDIRTVKHVRIITPAELRELDEAAARRMSQDKDQIQKRWEAYRQKQREALKARLEARKAARQGKGPDGKGPDGDGDEESVPVADQELEALFERYHPSKGWTPGRKRVIEWRRWTVGAFPTADEKVWLDKYDSWKKAYDQWLKKVSGGEPGQDEADPSTEKKSGGSSGADSKNRGEASDKPDAKIPGG